MLPSNIIKELQELTQTNRRGVDALYDAEIELANAENELDKVESQAFLEAQGTVADRQALARLEAADARLARDIAKAKVNRVRTKLKVIESEIMAQATMSKMMQAEMRL
jgi:hypothetical protein